MPGGSQSSFIPKRNPVKKTRKAISRRIYTVTIISYILIFSTLLAAAGVFVYKLYVERQLESEIAELSNEINRFDNSDLEQVKDFDARLKLASMKVDGSVSVASLFDALESATIGTVSFDKLDLARDSDDLLTAEVSIRTDSFDSSIFQREVMMTNGVVAGVQVRNLETDSLVGPINEAVVNENPEVTFDAVINVALDAIPYDPNRYQNVELTIPPPVTTTATQTASTTNITDL